MSKAILERWPHLQRAHVNYKDGIEFWKRRFRTCFKNKRGKNKENIQEILNQKVIYGIRAAVEEGESLIVKSRKLCSLGVLHYLPSLDPGEDNETQAKYIADEWRKPEHRRCLQSLGLYI